MENLKIKVNSADESKEAQELFFKLGASWCFGCHINDNLPHERDFILHNFGSQLFWAHTYESKNYDDAKEITLTELRAMVNSMKEYINKTTGEYRKTSDVVSGEQWIEVPDGATAYTEGRSFYKEDGEYIHLGDNKWDRSVGGYLSAVVWQRATHPEELPFIDDEPKYTDDEVKYMDENGQGRLQSINDQYAEIEQVRQHNHYFKDVSGLNEIDVYMVLKLFNVTDPCLQHIAKKALCAGRRGHKDFKKDLQDILDTAKRAVEINNG